MAKKLHTAKRSPRVTAVRSPRVKRPAKTIPEIVVPEDLHGIRYVLAEIVKRLGQLEKRMFG